MPSEFHTEFARNTFNFSSRLLIAIPTRAVGLKGELKSALVFESLRCGSFQSINSQIWNYSLSRLQKEIILLKTRI